jgi:hypothetical protein
MKNFLLFLFLFSFCNTSLLSQEEKAAFNRIISEDRTAIDALALYPPEIRSAILNASMHPEVIVKLDHVRENTREEFVGMIQNLSADNQQNIYDLARYDGLIDRLAEGKGRRSEEEIGEILKDYPQEIHETANRFNRNHTRLLKRISELNTTADENFNNILNGYNEEIKKAYQTLIKFPEILEILSDNMKLTVVLGDFYRREPRAVVQKLDSLNLEVARAHARESEEWKKMLEENPELLEEFQSSAERYAREKGFREEDYRREQEQINDLAFHHFYSYPFWFGYPYWMPYSYWYRWPVWYDWGFFYGPGGGMMLTGIPSYAFTYWYFHNPGNHFYYPRLSDSFITYYENRPRTSTGVSAGVSDWIRENNNAIPSNLLDGRGDRVQRLREYGLFESEYRERVQQRGLSISREEFLANNRERFRNIERPGLSAAPQGDTQRTPDRVPQDRRGDVRERPDISRDPASPEPERSRRPQIRDNDRRLSPRQENPERLDPGRQISPEQAPNRLDPAPRSQPPMERSVPPPPVPRDRGGEMSPAPQAPQQRMPMEAPRQERLDVRPMSIKIKAPSDLQKINNGQQHHIRNWKRNP